MNNKIYPSILHYLHVDGNLLIEELVDGYSPDLIWFDSWLDEIPDNYLKKMVAYDFNTAVSRGQQPIVNYKQEDLPANVGILDMEHGGKTEISDDYWLTDITVSYGSWSNTDGQTYKNPALVIRNMIDVWSKQGIVLLNISPMANGIIPDAQRDVECAIPDSMVDSEENIRMKFQSLQENTAGAVFYIGG